MQIKEISIKKFRQLENVEETNIGKINELYGSNGSGKTSFISFITWVLFDETLDYGKNNDMNIDSFNPDELIGGYIVLANDEEELTFKREYGVNYKGSKINLFYINERKVPQKEYFSMINNCFSLNQLASYNIKNFNLYRALYDPYYLPNNENMFRELISNILQLDTYSTLFEQEKYQPIKKDFDLQGRDFDKCKKFYKQQLEQIDKDLLITTSAINELKALQFNEENYQAMEDELLKLNEKSYALTNSKVLNEELDALQEKINKKKSELDNNEFLLAQNKLREETRNKYLEEVKELQLADQNNKNELKRINNEGSNCIRRIDFAKQQLAICEEKLKNEVVTCPHCKEVFNISKEVLEKEITLQKATLKELEPKVANYRKEFSKLKALDFEAKIKECDLKFNNELDKIKKAIDDYVKENTVELDQLNEEFAQKYRLFLEEKDKQLTEISLDINRLHLELADMEAIKTKKETINIHKENKKVLLENKSTYELRLRLLEDYRNDEIKLIENQTKLIFGEDLTFNLLEKYKTTDNFKLVCHASVDGLEHNRFNTAKYLQYSIIVLEKIKKYTNVVDMPIIFDIVDNIGKTARETIFKSVKNGQVFYTRIADEDNVKRQLKIIK